MKTQGINYKKRAIKDAVIKRSDMMVGELPFNESQKLKSLFMRESGIDISMGDRYNLLSLEDLLSEVSMSGNMPKTKGFLYNLVNK